VIQLITDGVILIIFSSWLRTTGILEISRSEDDVSDAENRIQASLYLRNAGAKIETLRNEQDVLFQTADLFFPSEI
jgi:hypothetical protein